MRDAENMLCDDDGTPDLETIARWSQAGEMDATDGCGPIEDDGYCEHGRPSWMLTLGFI